MVGEDRIEVVDDGGKDVAPDTAESPVEPPTADTEPPKDEPSTADTETPKADAPAMNQVD